MGVLDGVKRAVGEVAGAGANATDNAAGKAASAVSAAADKAAGAANRASGGILGNVVAAIDATIARTGSGKLALALNKFFPGGLPAFLDRLRAEGHGAAVDSWLGAGETRPVPAAAIAACLPEAVTERLAYDLSLPSGRVPAALAEFLPTAVAGESEDGRLRPQPGFSTQVR